MQTLLGQPSQLDMPFVLSVFLVHGLYRLIVRCSDETLILLYQLPVLVSHDHNLRSVFFLSYRIRTLCNLQQRNVKKKRVKVAVNETCLPFYSLCVLYVVRQSNAKVGSFMLWSSGLRGREFLWSCFVRFGRTAFSAKVEKV